MTHTISAVNRTDNVYGQVWIDGVTSQPGPTPGLIAQLGFGPDGSDPAGNRAWSWVDAGFNTDAGNNDEFVASLQPDATGVFDYAYRYTVTDGRDWIYADLDGIGNGYSARPGRLADRQPEQRHDVTRGPGRPPRSGSASPAGIELAWDAVAGDPTPLRLRGPSERDRGGPYATIATTSDADLHRHRRHRGPDLLLRRPLGGRILQSVGSVCGGQGDGRAADGDAPLQP